MALSAIQLVVNADDFGLSPAINAGIVTAHKQGIVTSTSMAASGAAFEEAVELARHTPTLAIGVHLTLVEEQAAVNGGTLAPNGQLPRSYGHLMKGVISGQIRLRDVEGEFRGQIEKCLKAGLKPTHLDSHQHTHAFPLLFPIARRLGREYGIPGIRIPRALPHSRDWESNRFLDKCVLSMLGTTDRLLFPSRTCDRFAGLFESGGLTEEKLLGILQRLRPGTTELMCHPAEPDSTPRYAAWNAKRQTELASLTSERAKQAIRERGVELITYAQI